MKLFKTSLLAVIFVCLNFVFCTSGGKTQETKKIINETIDTTKSAEIVLIPPFFEIPKPDGKFITEVLKIKNIGGKTLVIDKIEGSCYCASATILNSRIEPGEEGKIMLNVNLKGLYEDKNIVQYTIFSNAKNSPTGLDLTILPSAKDSTNKK